MRAISAIALCFLCATPTMARPARKAQPKTPTAAQVTAERSSDQSRIPDCAAAKSNFRAVSTSDFYENSMSLAAGDFGSIDLHKREFETEAQHDNRLAATVAKYFGDTDRSIFIATIPDNLINYDADAQRLDIRIAPPGVVPPWPSGAEFTLASVNYKTGSGVGTNAFGVKVRYDVYRSYTKNVRAVISDKAAFATKVTQISAPPAEAKSIKSHAVIVFYGSLVPSFFQRDETNIYATFSSPIELHETTDYYIMQPKCVFVADRATGRILGDIVAPTPQ